MNCIREYETFNSVFEMDSFISEALSYFELTEIERRLLRLLAGYSVKFIGVSFLKVASMADALEVSSKTIQRALKRLKEFGIIKRVRTLRPKRGGFGASLNIICPVALSYRSTSEEEAPEQELQEVKQASKRKETFFLKAFPKDLKELRLQTKAELDYTYLSEFVPEDFTQAVKPFLRAEEAFSLWGKAQAVARKYAPEVEELTEPAIRAFKSSVFAQKTSRIKGGNFGAYFWGALTGIFSREQRKLAATRSPLLYNWLEE
ncbi:Lrp/AsnC family transcriptional regulator [Bacillus sp. G1(2015b)]|uniref:Lrp/AsnC family transcriptional regulator n=1 Tax=Bacillus sp. G1(2015b) TaxID=1706732 RepID=UPI000738BABE|nr:Lrp/AsnC family transcriptional regulator [Bacillus sp. G1(2015b)]KUF21977.1 transcriptional regulator [Bacillus sp. G1(2015b)]